MFPGYPICTATLNAYRKLGDPFTHIYANLVINFSLRFPKDNLSVVKTSQKVIIWGKIGIILSIKAIYVSLELVSGTQKNQ